MTHARRTVRLLELADAPVLDVDDSTGRIELECAGGVENRKVNRVEPFVNSTPRREVVFETADDREVIYQLVDRDWGLRTGENGEYLSMDTSIDTDSSDRSCLVADDELGIVDHWASLTPIHETVVGVFERCVTDRTL